MKIYLAGSIPKSDKEKETFDNFRIRYQKAFEKILRGRDLTFIDPAADTTKDESDALGIFGKDCKSIKESDLVIVNAQERLGAGTAMELVVAKYFKKPVITVLPKDTHHRRSNITLHGRLIEDWIHPFIHSFTDLLIEQIEDLRKKDIKSLKPKDISIIDQAIKYAKTH